MIVDTTVQPKAITFPTDAKLTHRAREKLVGLAKKLGVTLRQSYVRVGKAALIAHQRARAPPSQRGPVPAATARHECETSKKYCHRDQRVR